MKKPGFIITEVVFSLLLAASVSAAGLLIYDLNTNQFHFDRFNPFAQQTETDTKQPEQSKAEEQTKPEQSSAAESQPSDQKESQESSQPSQTSAESSNPSAIQFRAEPADLQEQPQELVDSLETYGYALEGFVFGDHLIMVDTTTSDSVSKAKIYCYQQSDNGYWWNVVGDKKPLCEEAYIGENGSNFEPAPDSKVTPGGIFMAGQGFYIGSKPNTTYPLFEITDNTYWVTDPQSQFYNQRVEGTANKDWSKADHMVTSEKSYHYGLVVNYNTEEPSSEKTAAIFLRCGNTPTEGSIAVPEEVMKTILEWLDKDSSVTVYINV